jgi:hypothetical protein
VVQAVGVEKIHEPLVVEVVLVVISLFHPNL